VELDVRPNQGLGPLQLGLKREELRRALGTPSRSFKKAEDSTLTDAFDDAGIQIYYDAHDVCEAIEVASPAVPILQGRELLGKPFSEVRDWLSSLDPDLEVDDSGLTAPSIGLGIYAPSAEKSPDDPVEAVILFRRGYYG
jgi:hypothetical protein